MISNLTEAKTIVPPPPGNVEDREQSTVRTNFFFNAAGRRTVRLDALQKNPRKYIFQVSPLAIALRVTVFPALVLAIYFAIAVVTLPAFGTFEV